MSRPIERINNARSAFYKHSNESKVSKRRSTITLLKTHISIILAGPLGNKLNMYQQMQLKDSGSLLHSIKSSSQ